MMHINVAEGYHQYYSHDQLMVLSANKVGFVGLNTHIYPKTSKVVQ